MKPVVIHNSLKTVLFLTVSFGVLTGCGSGVGSEFEWSVGGDRQTIQPGQQAAFAIEVQSKTNIEAPVRLRVEGVPEGATATFDPASLGTTGNESTLRIQTTPATPVGTYSINIYAEEIGGQEYGPITRLLFVAGDSETPDISLEVTPIEHRFSGLNGFSPTITFYIRPLNGFLGTVDITVTESSPYVNVTQPPTPPSLTFNDSGGQGGTLVIRADDFPQNAPSVDLVVTATSGALVRSRTVLLHFGPAG